MRRTLLACLGAVFVSACSLAPYTPVVGAAAAGKTRVSLEDDPVYAPLVGQTLSVPRGSGLAVQAFDSGRMFVQPQRSDSTRFVCALASQKMTITAIYEDQVNGGVFYDANVLCPDGSTHQTVRNVWLDNLSGFPRV